MATNPTQSTASTAEPRSEFAILVAVKGLSLPIRCTRCLETGEAAKVSPGDDAFERLLFIASIPLLCIPALLFAGWRRMHVYWACPCCGSADIVPATSVRAKLLDLEARQAENWSEPE